MFNRKRTKRMYMKTAFDLESLQEFWAQQANNLAWVRKWDTVLDWDEPYAQWFKGGELNASYNCVDVHIKRGLRDKIALYWEGEEGIPVSWTYFDLYEHVNRYASVLRNLGVQKGDVVVLYLPMIPQTVAMMLAVVRLGATHSVVFSGYSSIALKERIQDLHAQFVVTADVGYRRGKKFLLKTIVDEAVSETSCVKSVVVIQRLREQIFMQQGRDHSLDELLKSADDYVEPVSVESTHPLFVLYTSGTTGKPKGIMHSTGGYLTYVRSTFKWAFDIKDDSVYWCAADIGWITGHSYIVYAPLLHGVTFVMHEGTPDYPDPGVWWNLIQKYKVSIFYTSPTALRLCMKFGEQWPAGYDLSSLKLLGSVGEVINPEVWRWYHKNIGRGACPISDTWWQTETGGFMISPTPGLNLVPLKPGSSTKPLPGIQADVVDEHGNSVLPETKGYLVIKKPWPGIMIGIHGDRDKFKEIYWSKFKGCYYPGDYALKDKEGYFWLLGRADEVLNISGHRIGTAEIESVVISLQEIVEAAAIGVRDEIRGEAIVIFAALKQGIEKSEQIKQKIKEELRSQIGVFIKPREIYFVSRLPKTRSGKIMRRLLKAILEKQSMGDISTLEDQAFVQEIQGIL
ncbi:MAG: acetate--CoA ligase [bacterium]